MADAVHHSCPLPAGRPRAAARDYSRDVWVPGVGWRAP